MYCKLIKQGCLTQERIYLKNRTTPLQPAGLQPAGSGGVNTFEEINQGVRGRKALLAPIKSSFHSLLMLLASDAVRLSGIAGG